MKLKGKLAVVTGASRGIGRGIALDLCNSGADVILTYCTNADMANSVVEEIKSSGRKGYTYPLNVSDTNSIDSFADEIKKTFGNIDILVNNAGINKPNDFDQISLEDWHEVMETNLTSVFSMSQKFLPLLNEGGSVVNISSVSGQYGGPRTTHYCVSKAGIIALTQNAAIFFAKKNIRVNAVSPGLIDTEMANAANQLGVDDSILLKRRGRVEEVAKVVSFLASDDASYITAQVINVNGGLYF